MTNLGEIRAPVFTGNKLTGKAAGQSSSEALRRRDRCLQEHVSLGDGSLQPTAPAGCAASGSQATT